MRVGQESGLQLSLPAKAKAKASIHSGEGHLQQGVAHPASEASSSKLGHTPLASKLPAASLPAHSRLAAPS